MYGFLTPEEEMKLLRQAPDGTYLFRFSNNKPKTLVFVVKQGTSHISVRIEW